MVKTLTILNPCFDVARISHLQDIPKNLCNMIQAKKAMQRHLIYMTDADYDCISDEIERQDKIEFERNLGVNSDEE